MKNPFKLLFGGRKPATFPFDTPIAPDRDFIAIGDVHGCDELLEKMINSLTRDYPDIPWVFLGDYVDRGPESARVLSLLRALQQDRTNEVVCLKGNHEKMMRDFLEDPLGRGERWIRFGGMETLRSFGLDPGKKPPTGDDLMELCEAFEACLLDELLSWIDHAPLSWSSGNVICVHAGLDPDQPVENQSRQTLLWGHKDFLHQPRNDGVWVVHGHTIVNRPGQDGGRISVDTGAYKSGTLTAAHVSQGSCRFFTA